MGEKIVNNIIEKAPSNEYDVEIEKVRARLKKERYELMLELKEIRLQKQMDREFASDVFHGVIGILNAGISAIVIQKLYTHLNKDN